MTDKDDLDEHELAELSKEVAKRLERRGVLQAGAGLAAGGAAGYLASGRASAGSQQTGTIGSGGSPVDVVAEDIYGPGGQGSGDSVAFEAVETGSLVDKSSGNSYDVDGLNVPDWEEDSNSPLNASGSQVQTVSLAGSYDLVKILVQRLENTSGGTQRHELRVNNNTTTSAYKTYFANGTTTATDRWILVDDDSLDGDFSQFSLEIGTDHRGFLSFDSTLKTDDISQVASGGRVSSTPLLDSITFRGGSGSISIKARLFGWSGGI